MVTKTIVKQERSKSQQRSPLAFYHTQGNTLPRNWERQLKVL